MICLVATDLTEQKRHEEILAAERLARSILEQAAEAIVVCDTQGTIIRASQATFEILVDNPLFQAFENVFPLVLNESEQPGERFAIGEVLQGRSFQGLETILSTKHLPPSYLLLSATPLHSDGEEIIGCIITLADISEFKQIEAERERLLEESRRQNELLERLIETAPLGIAVLAGPEHRFILANPSQRRLFPTIPEFVGRTIAQVWPEQVKVFNSILDRVARTGEPQFAVDALLQTHSDLEPREAFFTFTYSLLNASRGDNAKILMLTVETTEQVKARRQIEAELKERQRIERELRESQDRLLMTTEAAEIGMWEWDALNKTLTSDERCKDLFNLPPETILTYQAFLEAIHPDDCQRVEEVAQAAVVEHALFEVEFCTLGADESVHWIYAKGNSIYNDGGDPIQMFGVAMDVTRRKAIEAEIRANQAHIEVQHRLIAQREQERQQIARDLHDGILQQLIALRFSMHALLMENSVPEAAEQIEEMQVVLLEQINELRDYAGLLRPNTLIQFGLVKALQSHLEAFQEKYPEIQIQFEETPIDSSCPKKPTWHCSGLLRKR